MRDIIVKYLVLEYPLDFKTFKFLDFCAHLCTPKTLNQNDIQNF